MDYNYTKLPEEVVIVENYCGKGYVVEKGNKSMMDSALNWATGYGNKIQHKEYEYSNKDFTIELQDSAWGSNQGGKLSFWMCLLTAPDGKSWSIGIDSEMLLELLKNSTFVNGKCQQKVMFIRQNSRLGVCHEGMQIYKDALEDIKKRDEMKKATTKYNVGDRVGTLTGDCIYLGTLYKYYDRLDTWSYRDIKLGIYHQPKLVHVYGYISKYDHKWHISKIYDKKQKRLVLGYEENVPSAIEVFNEKVKAEDEYIKKQTETYGKWSDFNLTRYELGESPERPWDVETVKSEYLKVKNSFGLYYEIEFYDI